MEQEQTVVHIDITNGSTGLAVGTHVGQLVVSAKGFTVRGGTDSASDIEFLGDDIVPDGINSLDIILVACEGCHIGHTGIHIGGTHCMADGLILFNDWFVSLRVLMHNSGLATIVEEELGLVEVFLVTCYQIEFGQCHLSNLMAGHHTGLTWIWAYLATYTVGIADGDIEELATTCSLIVGYGAFYHMTKVIELMAQILFHAPALVASPLMGLFRILGSRSVKIAIGLLSRGNHVEHGVDILHELFVRIGL